MDQLAENSQRRLPCHVFGLGDGIAHAETHSEMLSQNNFHLTFFLKSFTLCHKVIEQKFLARLPHDFHSFTISSSALICSRNAERPFTVNE